MRIRTGSLDALFPRTRQGILAAILLQPGRGWFLTDLARHLKAPPSSLQRELARLVGAEILGRRREGNLVYYRANQDNPLFPELRGLLLKTAGLRDQVRHALEPFEKQITAAFVFGSFASARESSESDVDVFVLGGVLLSDLSPALGDLEERLGRPVNAMIYSPAEVAAKARAGHRLLGRVLEGRKLFVIGTEDDLAEVLGRQPRRPVGARKGRDR